MLKRCARRGGKRILIGWNRGLGDIALGLYAIVQRAREYIPDAEIVFLTRENLRDGFSLLEGVTALIDPEWKRGQPNDVRASLRKMGIDPKSFDLIIEKPSPTDWVRWQRGKVVPRLKWNRANDDLWKRFGLSDEFTYIGVQAVAETNYGLWRNWPIERWRELFDRLGKFEKVKILLFGFGNDPQFPHHNVIDLRGKTNLFELLSIIKNRCRALILPDSGVLSMAYYLDENFPIQVISLWGDPNHGVLKQAVSSPNRLLNHEPLVGRLRDLSTVSVQDVISRLFSVKPLYICPSASEAETGTLERTGCILLAGGQGSRLGAQGPKGIFPVLGKSLFQWVVEKAPPDFPIAVMTSPMNHAETIEFFRRNRHFGREVHFFSQELIPMLDDGKEPLDVLAPDGNGSVFRSFVKSGLADLFAKRGIELLTIVPVENPLADPADGKLIARLRKASADVVVKCVERGKPDEAMGALVEREGRIEIVEYLDLDPQLEYKYSNTGMLAMTLSFICQMAEKELPYHWVRKKIPGREVFAWKRERFIFDCLPYGRTAALCYPRRQCYAPIKNFDSIGTAEELLKTRSYL
jgi:UDP-N-acetylglucosamine/UDP-N-acetylgalactosamine diphosphorylase